MSEREAHDIANENYAKQWISFLQKRNRVLSIVWPILLILLIAATTSALYLFQKSQVLTGQNETLQRELNAASEDLAKQQAEIEKAIKSRNLLAEEAEVLRQNLSETEGETQRRLQMSEQLVETLKTQLQALKDENNSLGVAVDDVKAQFSNIVEGQKNQLASLKNKYEQERQALAENIANRKQAYDALVERQRETREEMERLANLVAERKQERSSLSRQNEQLRDQLVLVQKENNVLQAELVALQKKLSQLVAPIADSNPEPIASVAQGNAPPSNDGAPQINQSETDASRKQVVSQQKEDKAEASSAPAPFDFDSIAIDRP